LLKVYFGNNPGDERILEDPGTDGNFNNTLSFKGTRFMA
jgi:hypothetical protein